MRRIAAWRRKELHAGSHRAHHVAHAASHHAAHMVFHHSAHAGHHGLGTAKPGEQEADDSSSGGEHSLEQ
ncbi:hypothetical protein MTX20_12695 [Bradyrhizobium sp. ISRA435]|nr:hypothetical protein MTX20_12695 [Bradyrhizobium sp. ISRA435]